LNRLAAMLPRRLLFLLWSSGQGCNSLIGGKARERPTAHDPVKA
jgi:hypothetical protein